MAHHGQQGPVGAVDRAVLDGETPWVSISVVAIVLGIIAATREDVTLVATPGAPACLRLRSAGATPVMAVSGLGLAFDLLGRYVIPSID